MVSNNDYCLHIAAQYCTVHVTIFSTGGKFQPVSNFTELHVFTQATRSCALLIDINDRDVSLQH